MGKNKYRRIINDFAKVDKYICNMCGKALYGTELYRCKPCTKSNKAREYKLKEIMIEKINRYFPFDFKSLVLPRSQRRYE